MARAFNFTRHCCLYLNNIKLNSQPRLINIKQMDAEFTMKSARDALPDRDGTGKSHGAKKFS
jgi:hypothetical protein